MIIDGSEFIRIYNENTPAFDFEKIKDTIIPRRIDDNCFTCFGYKINIKSTIFKDAKSEDLIKGWNMFIDSFKYQDIFESYFELEIYNYCSILNGLSGYLFPILDLLKLCYWFYKCSKIPESSSKLLQIKKEILGKSKAIKKHSKASESIEEYEDLLDTTSDFYTEIMFATLSQLSGHGVLFNKTNDFVIDNNIAEVKSIHDKFNIKDLDTNSDPILKMALPDDFGINDLKHIICAQIIRNKWICHLTKAIEKQKGKIILVNATHSQELQRVSIFLEEKGLRKSFDNMLKKSLSFLNNNDSIPVLVMLESIHQYHITTFFSFLAPVKDKDSNAELDLTMYTVEYIKNNIGV